MIEAAERVSLLKPGGTIVVPTSGNTGHGQFLPTLRRVVRGCRSAPSQRSAAL